MSRLHPFALKCVAIAMVAQLYAIPAVANNVSTGGFIVIGSKPLSLQLRSAHRVHRHYIAPKVYHHKTKPKAHYDAPKKKAYRHKSKPRLHHVKRKQRHHRTVRGFRNKHGSPYYIQRRYGIQHRGYRYGLSRRRH